MMGAVLGMQNGLNYIIVFIAQHKVFFNVHEQLLIWANGRSKPSLFVQAAKAVSRQHICTGWTEPK